MAQQSNSQGVAKNDTTAMTIKEKYNFVENIFKSYTEDIAKILPAHLTPERCISLALTEFRRNDKLQQCDPYSFVQSVFMASRIGLEIGVLGLAHLIPYGKECQLIPGYKGLVDLAMRDGKVKQIYARVVYQNDEFDYTSGTEEKIIHKPCLSGERGPLVVAYAVAQFHDGHVVVEVMTRQDIEHVRKSSRGYKPGYESPWTTHEAEMWKKTVIRRLCKSLPQSIELNTALTLVDAENMGKIHKFDMADVINKDWIPAISNDDDSAIDVSSNEPTASEKAAAKARERMAKNHTANTAPESEPAVYDGEEIPF